MIKKLSILLSLFIISFSVLTSQQAEAKNKIWNKPKGSIIWAKDADYIAKKLSKCLGDGDQWALAYGDLEYSDEQLEYFRKNQPCMFDVMDFGRDVKGYHEITDAKISDYILFCALSHNKLKYSDNKKAVKSEKITKDILKYYKKNKITKLNYAYRTLAAEHHIEYYPNKNSVRWISYKNGKMYITDDKTYSEKPLTLKKFKYYMSKVKTPYWYK